MADRGDDPRPEGEQAIRRQLEELLSARIGLSMSAQNRRKVVEQVLRQQQEEIALEVEALVRRLQAQVEAQVQGQAQAPAEGRQFLRFSLNFRLQHIVLFTSCIVLILTGLPIKFHDTAWAAFMFGLMGGIERSALLHRFGAVGLIGVGLYHLLYTAAWREGRWNFSQLIPASKDLKDLAQMLRHFLGRTEERPRFGRFSYMEKFDYWAVYWGMVIMCGSGIMLWFENQTMRLFPKYVFDIAKEAHSDEALLATLAIIIWHFYNVHFNPRKFPMNKVWLSGRLSEEEMREEHPLEYEEIVRREAQEKGGAP